MKSLKLKVWDGKTMYYPQADENATNHYLQFGEGGFWLFDGDGNMITNTKDGGMVLLSTGLHDLNKKEIYVGDIITYKKPRKTILDCVVELDYGRFSLVWGDMADLSYPLVHSCEFDGDLMYRNDIEIIGNIYENPELNPNQ